MDLRGSLPSYLLITTARNEEHLIHRTIESVVRQTVLPLKWLIVDDGSTDKTAQKVKGYLANYSWIEMIQRPQHQERSFAGKGQAFNEGYERVRNLSYDIVGNLDADISFAPDYFEFLLRQFGADGRLGVAGTVFREDGYSSERQSFEGQNHVAGGCQLFRRQCWEEIGGYAAHRGGGIDWIAVTTARMVGWKTRSFREKSFFHHRHLGTADRSRIASAFSYGRKDYCLGGHPIWEMFRVAYQVTRRPYIAGGLALAAGYSWASLCRVPRPISPELMAFHRREQMRKLKAILKSVLTFKRLDSFTVSAD
jgi:poly-beta-1,6-N-acetyl-D-glucosamine synthase